MSGGNNRQTKGAPGESHHLWAKKACKISAINTRKEDRISLSGDVPCIRMEKREHQKTLSWGRWNASQLYSEVQAELLSEGRFEAAFYMDALDHHCQYDDKYHWALSQAEQQLLKLHDEEKIALSPSAVSRLEDDKRLHEEIASLDTELNQSERLMLQKRLVSEVSAHLKEQREQLCELLELKFKEKIEEENIQLSIQEKQRIEQTYGFTL